MSDMSKNDVTSLHSKIKYLLQTTTQNSSSNNNDHTHTHTQSQPQSTHLNIYHQETKQERYLTCCCCLLLSLQQQEQQQEQQQASDTCSYITVQNFMEEYPELKCFIHELLRVRQKEEPKDDLSIVYQRIGIRLLRYYYLSGMQQQQQQQQQQQPRRNKEEWKEHFQIIHQLLTSRFHLNINIHILDVELVQLLALLLQNYNIYWNTDDSQSHNNNNDDDNDNDEKQWKEWITHNYNKLIELPEIIFEHYYCHYNTNAYTNTNADKSDIENEHPRQIMITIMTSILDNNNNNNNNRSTTTNDHDHDQTESIGMKQQFELIMIQCLNYHIRFIQGIRYMTLSSTSTSRKNLKQGILSRSMFLNMIQCIISSPDDQHGNESISTNTDTDTDSSCPLSILPDTTRILLLLSLLSIIHSDITTSMTTAPNSMLVSSYGEDMKRNWNILLSLSTSTSTSTAASIDMEVAESMQKLIVFNMSSALDSYMLYRDDTKNHNSNNQSNNDNMMMMITKIRTMTLDILNILMEECKIDWICVYANNKTKNERLSSSLSSSSSSSVSLGESSIFCTLVRLVVGEVRLVMGHLIDYDPINDDNCYDDDNVLTYDNDLKRIKNGIEIMLQVLRIMLGIANNVMDEDERAGEEANIGIPEATNRSSWNFNPDAILHIKHSLDDMLNSVVQFLLFGKISLTVNDADTDKKRLWEEGALYCCRYLGAYLSEVDIFEYDDGADNIEGDEEGRNPNTNANVIDGYPTEGTKTATSSHRLFMALRNGLLLVQRIENDIGSVNDISDPNCTKSQKSNTRNDNPLVNVVTLFPSIIATLSSCFDGNDGTDQGDNKTSNKRHVKMVKTYLLNDDNDNDVLIALLCSVMDQTLDSFKKSNGTIKDEDAIVNITWCNIIIESLFEFMVKSTSLLKTSDVSSGSNKSIRLSSKDDERIRRVFSSISNWMKYLVIIDYDYDTVMKEKSTNILLTMMRNLIIIKGYVSTNTLTAIDKDVDELMAYFPSE